MANLTDADLDSHIVDLTAVPLAELRTLNSSALADALERMYATAEHVTGSEVQVQATPLGSRH
ncbi:FxSxx-COOH cyclophane-containing RiPP peptide [Actinophytocola sp.]|uniref:FxSxx-COOH cyclophane-containing RiPP peptide n=1 Tax=Actinophytocola sp. TaxID=1872138 RepID=UPI003899A7DE